MRAPLHISINQIQTAVFFAKKGMAKPTPFDVLVIILASLHWGLAPNPENDKHSRRLQGLIFVVSLPTKVPPEDLRRCSG